MTRRRRFRWRCHECGAYGSELTPGAARDAGLDHWIEEHSHTLDREE